MSPASQKSLGYLLSLVSVVLLGVVSWKSAQSDPLLAAALVGGMGTSLIGLVLRWWANRRMGS